MPMKSRVRRRGPAPIAALRPHPRGRRRPVVVALVVVVAAVVAAFTAAAALDRAPERGEAAPVGRTDRSSFLLVEIGKSRAEVRALLGPPHSVEAGTRSGQSECWLYEPRSGNQVRYQLCFAGNFLLQKSILRR
jgi:hypothetical protein